MSSILYPLFFFLLMIGALIFIPRFMIRRALRQTIAIFRHFGVNSPDKAKTRGELGLNPADFMTRITSLRDYKPQALQILMGEGVVASTEEGKLYLVEGKCRDFFEKRL
ncbi:MAG: hypothetical protein H6Q42_1834 [Deltaproteobacteria bacterium]|nr:hypothetical protein [Deltaproteobacteria bacterium]